MIFISYNHKDEQLVDMVARRLELEFGRDNMNIPDRIPSAVR